MIVARVSLEHFILCDQPAGTFGEKNLVTKLDRGLHFATLDQIGVGFKDAIDLFGAGNLLALEHTTSGLIDHTVSQFTVVVDLFPESGIRQVGDQILAACLPRLPNYLLRAVDDLLGDANELTIFLGLPFMSFLWRHPLDFSHPTPRYTAAIVKSLDTLLNRSAQAENQASDHAHDIP